MNHLASSCGCTYSPSVVRERQSERLGLRISPSEADMLRWLSETTGLSMSDVVRQLIRRTYSERFGELSRAKKPKR